MSSLYLSVAARQTSQNRCVGYPLPVAWTLNDLGNKLPVHTSVLLFLGIFAFQRLRFVSLIHAMSPSSFWYRGVNIILRNRGFMVPRFLLWTL